MNLPGLARDSFTASRPAQTADSEGDITATLSVAVEGRGSIGTPTLRDVTLADHRGEVIDKVLASQTAGVKVGDRVGVAGHGTFDCVNVDDTRPDLRFRYFLRRVA